MIYTTRPISDRTTFTGDHTNSKFTVSWSACLELLDRELWHLDATNLIFEVDVPERGIRLDGQLRADAKAATPAVRIAFDSNQGPLVYATDMFIKPAWRRNGMQQDWQHNIYAIALGLEALRKVDRYGITKRGEQYAGWKAIGPGTGTGATALGDMTADDAWAILGSFGERPIHEQKTEPDGLRRAYRKARAFAHPDRHDGDRHLWDQVEQAAQVLGLQS